MATSMMAAPVRLPQPVTLSCASIGHLLATSMMAASVRFSKSLRVRGGGGGGDGRALVLLIPIGVGRSWEAEVSACAWAQVM